MDVQTDLLGKLADIRQDLPKTKTERVQAATMLLAAGKVLLVEAEGARQAADTLFQMAERAGFEAAGSPALDTLPRPVHEPEIQARITSVVKRHNAMWAQKAIARTAWACAGVALLVWAIFQV